MRNKLSIIYASGAKRIIETSPQTAKRIGGWYLSESTAGYVETINESEGSPKLMLLLRKENIYEILIEEIEIND